MRSVARGVLFVLSCALLGACGGSDSHEAPQPAGRVDGTFGEGGMLVVPNAALAGTSAQADEVAVLDDGRVLVSGTYHARGDLVPRTGAIARVLPTGRLDAAFANGGVLGLTGSALHSVSRTRVVASAEPVWAHVASCIPGSHDPQCATGHVFARRLAAGPGAIDNRYGFGGTASVGLSAWAVLGAPDGSLIVIGTADPVPPPSGGSPRIQGARVDRDGRLDADYAARATAALATGCPAVADSLAAARQADGHVLVAWARAAAPFNEICMARLQPDGARDPRFGVAGAAVVGSSLPAWHPAGLLVRDDGSSVLLLRSTSLVGGSAAALLWVAANGARDPARGVVATADVDVALVAAIAQQADGKILLAGHPPGSTGSTLPTHIARLVRLDRDGRPDRTFGPAGSGVVALSTFGLDLVPRGITVSGGSIYVAGSVCPAPGGSCTQGEGSMAVMRITAGSW